jgi:hypothetical protein
MRLSRLARTGWPGLVPAHLTAWHGRRTMTLTGRLPEDADADAVYTVFAG